MKIPAATQAWKLLTAEFKSLNEKNITIRSLFDNDPLRFDKYSISTPEMVFDYSKNLVTDEIQQLLFDLADQCQVPTAIDAMFAGDKINPTENRSALHVALRGHSVDDIDKQVNETLGKMAVFVSSVRDGEWTGYSGKPISDIVNIGIGGSHLGPAMVVRALQPYADDSINCHFLSNIDPAAATETLRSLNPESTLFIIASKSFTTLETHHNANIAKQWFVDQGGHASSLGKHFVAVSSNVHAAEKFGIDSENIFPMWDWVGGRYSLWSAIGLPIALTLGMDLFRDLLSGAHHADEHFRTNPLSENIPVTMALLTIWYSGFFDTSSQAILPYSQNLELFPAFLQQLSMESLGKSVDLQGQFSEVATGAIIWGAPGTDGQHSFHQLLHQGTRLVPADFIAVATASVKNHETQQAQLLANCFSQSQALMDGKTTEQAMNELVEAGISKSDAQGLAKHKAIPGNRPSNTLLMHKLDPHNLGYLAAIYEHAVYVQSVIWNINAFDQWGVELGKELSSPLYESLISSEVTNEFDSSTNNLVTICKAWKNS